MQIPTTQKAMIRPRLLRYWVCLQLDAARAPMKVSDLVARFEQSPFMIRGRTSKAISDTIRWAIPRGWTHAIARGTYGPGRIPVSTLRYMRKTLEVAEANGVDPSWRKTQRRKQGLPDEN